jgi:predicted dehydrogenase
MPHNLKAWIIGVGGIGQEYAKILAHLGIPFKAIGRGDNSSASFTEITGYSVIAGGLHKYLATDPDHPDFAIVAVSADQLSRVAELLLEYGIKKILIEKPAALNSSELRRLAEKTRAADVHIAYNRRYLSSVQAAISAIESDGGVRSFHFEFTEWPSRILAFDQPPGALENWFYLNSSHVTDLAFFLGGLPKEISCFSAGELEWHKPAIFSGAGITENDVPFSYKADWGSAGRWSVEIMTSKRRLILSPLEQLKEQRLNDVNVYPIEIDDACDKQFKPGFLKQVEAFIGLKGQENLLTLQGQIRQWSIYERMMGQT